MLLLGEVSADLLTVLVASDETSYGYRFATAFKYAGYAFSDNTNQLVIDGVEPL